LDKYVGEMEAEDFKNTIFSNDGRYTQFTMEDAIEAEHYFTMLMGEDIDSRKDFIYNNINWDDEIE
jgi:DNA gyrase subunit B